MKRVNCIGPRCATCQLQGVAILNAMLINGLLTLEEAAERYGISTAGLWRHAQKHLPPGITMMNRRGPRGTKYKSRGLSNA
jgi:hypothetical protein